MDIKTTIKAIKEMVKQYDKLLEEEFGEEKFRDKSIRLIYNTFSINDIYRCEILFDIAYYGEGVYLSDTDDEIEYKIKLDGGWFKASRIYDTQQCVYNSYSSNDLMSLLDFLDGKTK